MKKLVFVCLGNICRSPMAEFVMKSMTDNYEIQSRATSSWEHGNPIHKGTQGIFQQYEIPLTKAKHRFRLVRKILKTLIILSEWMLQMFLTYVRCVQQTVKIRFTHLHQKVFQILGIQEILRKPMLVSQVDVKAG